MIEANCMFLTKLVQETAVTRGATPAISLKQNLCVMAQILGAVTDVSKNVVGSR